MLIEETDKLYGIDETNNKTWGDSQADGEKHGQKKSRTATTKTMRSKARSKARSKKPENPATSVKYETRITASPVNECNINKY
jgi:hypothetical protein